MTTTSDALLRVPRRGVVELSPAARHAVRARRHPRVIAALWVYDAAMALVAAWPIAALAGAAYGAGPRGDAPLWDPGGHALLDFLWHASWGRASAWAAAEAVFVVGAVVGLVPAAAAMTALSQTRSDGRPLGTALSLWAGAAAFPKMLALQVMTWTAQAVLIAVAVLIFRVVSHVGRGALGEVHAAEAGAVLAALVGLAVVGLGVLSDLARAVVVRWNVPARRALRSARSAWALAPWGVAASWAIRGAASILPVLAVAPIADRLGGYGGASLLLLAALHQGAALARVAGRVSWLADALRRVDAAPPPSRSLDPVESYEMRSSER